MKTLSELDCNELLGGVLTYSTNGHNKICGQIIGANGCGDFCVLISGTPEQAEEKARSIIRDLEKSGYKFNSVIFVPNDNSGYFGRNNCTFIQQPPKHTQ